MACMEWLGGDFEKLFPRDMIITNVMLYWVTNSFWSAIRLYSESYYHPWELMLGARIEVPTAVVLHIQIGTNCS